MKDLRCKILDALQRLINKVAFKPKLQLCHLFAIHSLIIKLKEALSYGHWVDIIKLNREEHLGVANQLFEHISIAVLQHSKDLLKAFEDLVLRLRRVDPLRQIVK